MNAVFSSLADLVILLHVCFVVFAILGGLFVLKWKWAMWIHLPAAMWGAMIEFTGWICPLTPLENWFRDAGGGQGYQGSFIEHYVIPLLYPAGLTRGTQFMLGILVILLNAGVYSLVFYRNRKSSNP